MQERRFGETIGVALQALGLPCGPESETRGSSRLRAPRQDKIEECTYKEYECSVVRDQSLTTGDAPSTRVEQWNARRMCRQLGGFKYVVLVCRVARSSAACAFAILA